MKTTQTTQILKALKKGARLTPMDALKRFGCFRLGARIADLRKAGHDIKTRIVHKDGKNFAEYYLVGA